MPELRSVSYTVGPAAKLFARIDQISSPMTGIFYISLVAYLALGCHARTRSVPLLGSPEQLAARAAKLAPPLVPQHSVRAHEAEVHALAYSRDGKLLVSAGRDAAAKLWDARTGRRVRTLRVQTQCVAFSPDGLWLATGNYDNTPEGYAGDDSQPATWLVRVWNVHTGRTVRTLRGHRKPVTSIEWSPNGKLLATASEDGTVRVWRTNTWQPVVTLREAVAAKEKSTVVAKQARFAPDGTKLAVVSVINYPEGMPGPDRGASRVVLWDTATWKRTRILLDEEGAFSTALAFSPDGHRLMAATAGWIDDGEVLAWELPSGAKIMQGWAEAGYTAVSIPPGLWLATSDKGNRVFLRDPETGSSQAVLACGQAVTSIAASPDGNTLAVGDSEGMIRFWRLP
jgi:WD40 repeat protein